MIYYLFHQDDIPIPSYCTGNLWTDTAVNVVNLGLNLANGLLGQTSSETSNAGASASTSTGSGGSSNGGSVGSSNEGSSNSGSPETGNLHVVFRLFFVAHPSPNLR